jgi:DNA polymerase III delta prime subunit
MKIITRKDVINILQQWKENVIDAVEVFEIANKLYDDENLEVTDWENGEDYSATLEVLQCLESLDINLIIQDDIDYYIEFLNTKKGNFLEGNKKLNECKSLINYEERKRILINIPPYSKFLANM